MSYAAFGQSVHEACGTGKRLAKRGSGTTCCNVEGWSNKNFRDAAGAPSFLKRNEERVVEALALLLAPTNARPTGVEHFAYEKSAAGIQPGLVSRLAFAKSEFQRKTPWRWTYTTVPGYENLCLPQKIWKENAPKLASNLAGVVNRVPSAEDSRLVRDKPVRSELLTMRNGQIVPTTWTEDFLKTFAGSGKVLQSGWKPTFQPSQSATSQADVPVYMEPEPATDNTKIALIATGVIVLGGVAYLALRKRR